MNCLRCNTANEEGAKFCRNCGMDLTFTAPVNTATAGKSDVLILTAYIGWHFLTYLLYTFINKVIVPKMIKTGTSVEISSFYKVTDWVISGIDIVFLLVMVILLKNNMAKIFCIIFLVLRIALLALHQFSS